MVKKGQKVVDSSLGEEEELRLRDINLIKVWVITPSILQSYLTENSKYINPNN